MKNIYLSLAGLVLCGTVFSQNSPIVPDQNRVKGILAPNSKSPNFKKSSTDRAAGPFRMWSEPVGDVMTQKGLTLTGNTPDENTFIDGIFMDSTVRIGSGTPTNRFVSTILLGSILDPKSTNLQASFEPIVTKLDPYSIDSLQILGSYVKKTATIDTLYIWLVWGDTTNTSVFTKRLTNATWNPPISTWRHSVIGPKVIGAAAGPGNKVKPAAPAGNQMLIKYVLQSADSSSSQHIKWISIPLTTPAAIPAGSIVSCIYTFVPGTTYAAGDCIYSFSGAAVTQNVNGFAAAVWGQTNPAVNALTDYVDQQVDPSSWCMGVSYDNTQRHNMYPTTWSTFTVGDLTTAPVIAYSIYGTSTVGISELAKNGFALSQNTPNPFNKQTTINYQIKNAASNVALEIYDIRGVKMYEKTQKDVREGKYSVEINNVDFASGIYFYSLIVDGNKITKKMIVQ